MIRNVLGQHPLLRKPQFALRAIPNFVTLSMAVFDVITKPSLPLEVISAETTKSAYVGVPPQCILEL
ncbi:hypothetical protein V6N12_073846 [Hibiscus sabdariffa]|uniref:Uncharacterized protein n=1 Tax=Hibiscus sabdariffa TaxID=183260 RepID=A0ABR2B7B6_9ROSI